MKLKRKNPCNECPFKKDSVQGWLGPWGTPTNIMAQSMSEAGLACHKDVDLNPELEPGEHHVCVGSLQHANASAKKYQNPLLAAFAQAVGKSENILGMMEFVRHHTVHVFRARVNKTDRMQPKNKAIRGI